MNLLVSIIVPCYNQGEFLLDVIESVIDQDYTNWECIIVNDGSTDDTESISLKLCTVDDRIKYFSKVNGGLSSARNFGILHAKGKLILPLDADDKISINYLSRAIKIFSQIGNSVIIYGECHYFGNKKGICELPIYDEVSFLLKNQIHCSGVYLKSDWEKIGGYDESMKYGNEDWEFWIRMITNGCEVIYCEEMKFFYRQKETSMLHQTTLRNKELINNYVVNKHFTLYEKKMGHILKSYTQSRRFSIFNLFVVRVKLFIKNRG